MTEINRTDHYCLLCMVRGVIAQMDTGGRCYHCRNGHGANFASGEALLGFIEAQKKEQKPPSMTKARFLAEWAGKASPVTGPSPLTDETHAQMGADLDALVEHSYVKLAEKIEDEYASYERADEIVSDLRTNAKAWAEEFGRVE